MNARVRAYIAKAPPQRRAALKKIRATVRAVAPRAVEWFSYGIPGFRLEGKTLVWYAGFREHCSIYPITGRIQRRLAAALKGYETSKGTVRLPLSKPMPVGLIKKLVKARLAEIRKGHRP